MNTNYKIKIISGTSRPGRNGPKIGAWISDFVTEHSSFDVEFIDLGELNLPMMDEPNHPRLKQYQHDHTKRWSKKIDESDGFIIVTGEYNHSFPAPLKNALDYLAQEWANKPVGFVSYGGISGGTRAANALTEVVTTLKMIAVPEAVHIPFYTNYLNEDTGKVSKRSYKTCVISQEFE